MQDFSGFEEQDFPYKCPECDMQLELKDCVGVGDYPKGGFRSSMKPNCNVALGFECPKCFTKSCFHADKYSVEMFEDYQKLMKEGRI